MAKIEKYVFSFYLTNTIKVPKFDNLVKPKCYLEDFYRIVVRPVNFQAMENAKQNI